MKIWAFSDTHSKERELNVPSGIDMAICAGDIGTMREPGLNANVVLDFIEWYASLTQIRHKILIAGNHDTSIQAGLVQRTLMPESIIYLEHESVTVDGIKIFGSPYTPSFGTGWAYNVPRQALKPYWDDIPMDTDILVTHGPPKGILDLTQYDSREGADGQAYFQCGCRSLLNRIREVKPKYHIFGHIHPETNCPNAGILKIANLETTFVNAAVLDLLYKKVNDGFIIEI